MKNLFKIVTAFAMIFASLSWGNYIEYLTIRVGYKSTPKNTILGAISPNTGNHYVMVTNTEEYPPNPDAAQDVLANTGLGDYYYAYMGYTDIPYVKNVNGSNYLLPITNIIVRDYSSNSNVPESFVEGGATYYRVHAYKDDTAEDVGDICRGKCKVGKVYHYVYVYFTRDYIDGKYVQLLKAVKNTVNWTGYTQIPVDLTGGKGSSPIYLYMHRVNPYTDLYFYPEPSIRNSTNIMNGNYLEYTGTSRELLSSKGTPFGSHADHVEYKVNNYAWTTDCKATNAGDYSVLAKIVSNHPMYADYIYYDTLKTTIAKARHLVVNQYENGSFQDYYLYSSTIKNQNNSTSGFYSGDQIRITGWSDKCGSSSRTFSYYNNGTWNTLPMNTNVKLNSGSYSFKVKFAETSNCLAMDESFTTVYVSQSKLIFNGNGGTFSDGNSTSVVAGETGNSFTAPVPTKTGYTFNGWNTTLPSTIQRGEKTYTAQWKVNQYTLTFAANGGKFSDGSANKKITQDYLTSITRPANPTRTDYVFTGWNRSVPSYMPAKNMVIIAQWKYDRFKVNMPSLMEVVSGDQASDGTYLNGSTVKFRVQSGYVVWGTVTYNGTVVTPDANGIYTIKVLGKDASVSATAFAEDHGAIQIAVDRSKAIIDGNKTGLVTDVPTAIAVGKVEMARTFTPFISTTIAVPFEVDLEYVWGGIFCEFLGMEKSGFKYTARLMFVSTKLEANVPYVFVPFDEHISIDLPQGWTLPIKTEEKSVVFGNWSFNSVYHKKVWTDGVSEEDGEGVVGYGFNASQSQSDGVSGSFAKLTSGSVGAMQAYMAYRNNAPQAVNRSPSMAAKSASFSIEDLPDEIDIELVTEDKKTVGLGKINTVTGKIKLDCWFDMNGNLLKGKPTAKGVYVNNGRQVIVK